MRVLIAAGVAEPNIIASTSHNKGRSQLRLVHDPAIGRVKDAVLEVNNRLRGRSFRLSLKSLDSEHSKSESVWGLYNVLLVDEAVLLHDLLEAFAHIGISHHLSPIPFLKPHIPVSTLKCLPYKVE